MELDDGVRLDDDLVDALIECGRRAHVIAQAHHNDPGSNVFTFGGDRYHRAVELARGPLEEHGYRLGRRGAALIASRDGVELNFATARGPDLTDPNAFDPDSAPGRRRAGETNTVQLAFDGMPEVQPPTVVHVVWSGSPHAGLTAVHIGKLVSGDGRLQWSYLHRVDAAPLPPGELRLPETDLLPGFLDQPLPTIELRPRQPRQGRGRGTEQGWEEPAG